MRRDPLPWTGYSWPRADGRLSADRVEGFEAYAQSLQELQDIGGKVVIRARTIYRLVMYGFAVSYCVNILISCVITSITNYVQHYNKTLL